MEKFNKVLITAALPYANGPIHIGHLAGCYLPADIYARYQRAQKREVKFICGSDEHGVPITIRARKEGKTPQQVVDFYHNQIKDTFQGMNISFDIFSRTSSDLHRQTSQAFFKDLFDKGIFEEKVSEHFYDPIENQFLADRYIVGECPKCHAEGAYGDQCEKCGSTLSPDQLINPKSSLSAAKLEKKETTHWYFPLNKYEDFLKNWILEGKKGYWKPNVYGQCKSWLDDGLQPRAMTRDSEWGVPVPLENAEGKVLYVWFDAPIGYISATKELLPQGWDDYWKKEDTKLVHFIGKDNIVFHCIIFPAMLHAHGDFVLPDQVPANEFLNIEGQKVSTSRNWAVWVDDYRKDFPEMEDALRYVLTANAPETKDNDFTWKDFQSRVNNELVAAFGNFVNRAMILMHKLCNGRMPKFWPDVATERDDLIVQNLQKTVKSVTDKLETYHFKDALFDVIELSRHGNKYLQECEPWILAKTPESQAENQKLIDNCLHVCIQLTANLSILMAPFLPETSKKMNYMLKVVDRMLEWENAGRMDLIQVNYPLRAPELLFRRVEDTEMETQREKLIEQSKLATPTEEVEATTEVEPLKEEIQFDDFMKIDLRVGHIISAEKIKKADKLLHLKVDLGFEERTILSGIAEHYAPEEVVGKRVSVVVNLAPRKMRGIMSEGMILMTENEEGKLIFVSPLEEAKLGASIL